jgi:hypothetical protein
MPEPGLDHLDVCAVRDEQRREVVAQVVIAEADVQPVDLGPASRIARSTVHGAA